MDLKKIFNSQYIPHEELSKNHAQVNQYPQKNRENSI